MIKFQGNFELLSNLVSILPISKFYGILWFYKRMFCTFAANVQFKCKVAIKQGKNLVLFD